MESYDCAETEEISTYVYACLSCPFFSKIIINKKSKEKHIRFKNVFYRRQHIYYLLVRIFFIIYYILVFYNIFCN